MLLVDQNAGHAPEIGSRRYVLQTGGFNYCQRRLRNDERVREAYLGRSAAERLRI